MSNKQNLLFRCAALALASSLFIPILTSCNKQSVPAFIRKETSSVEPLLEPLPESSQPEFARETTASSEYQDASFEKNRSYSEDSSSQIEAPTSRTLEVETIYQTPELPTGCEITALTMALRYAGYPVSKTAMAKDYLPKSSNWYYVGSKKYGPDFRKVFSGDPFTNSGCVCSAPAIVAAADSYLTHVNGSHRAQDLTGTEPEELYSFVLQGTPVVVWVTIEMADRTVSGGWYVAETEEYLEWSKMDHCAVLIGVDEDHVIFNDPITGRVTYSKARFESVYEQRGNQAVILTET